MADIRHLNTHIKASADAVYDFIADPDHLPKWAAGLASSSLSRDGEQWAIDSPMGRVLVNFEPHNQYRVFDHLVTLPNGEQVLNPVRVLPDGDDACDIVFTVRRYEMSSEQFDADCKAVQADLTTLKNLMEKPARNAPA